MAQEKKRKMRGRGRELAGSKGRGHGRLLSKTAARRTG